MKAVFADTFYWAALTSTDDNAHQHAMDLSRSLAPEALWPPTSYFPGASTSTCFASTFSNCIGKLRPA